MKIYGSLSNRFEENKMHVSKIEVSTPCTKYFCSSYTKCEDNMKNTIARSCLTEKQIERFEKGETIVKRGKQINISFGVADEYFDFSF